MAASVALLAAGLSPAVSLAGPHGGSGFAAAPPSGALPGGSTAGMNSNGRMSVDRDLGRDRAEDRGQATSHMSSDTIANGRNALDRDRDLDRAEDRRRNRRVADLSNGRHAGDRDFGRDRAEDRAHHHHHHHHHHRNA